MRKIDFKSMIIIVLVIILLLTKMCSFDGNKPKSNTIKVDGKKYTLVKHIVDTTYKTINKIVYKPGNVIYKVKPIYVEIPQDVDTLSILKDYYAKYEYIDTLKLTDSLGYITITDTIFKNKILDRVYNSHVNKITITDTKYILEPPKRELFLGGVLGFDKVDIINYAAPTIMLKDKKDKIYSIGVGYNSNKTISIQGGLYWKLKFKK